MYNINDITRYTDLKNNDSLSAFRGHTAQQFHGAYEVFYKFIESIKPSRILEIGTSLGGFTSFLKIVCDELKLNTNIRSYDIVSHPWYQDIINMGIDLHIKNIFTANFIDCDEEVKDYIKQDGTTVILCDGGYKIGEFNLLSKFIKSGDFILAHDYAENSEIFQKQIFNKIWNWHEIQYVDVKQSIEEHNLQHYMQNEFCNVAWLCVRKA